MYCTKLHFYLIKLAKHSIVTRMSSHEDKSSILGGLVFKGWYKILMVHTNLLCYHSMILLSWLLSVAQNEQNIGKCDVGWCKMLQCGWHSKFPYQPKLFIWRVIIENLQVQPSRGESHHQAHSSLFLLINREYTLIQLMSDYTIYYLEI